MCNIKLDKDNFKKDRIIFKLLQWKKNNNDTLIQYQQPKYDGVNKKNNNPSLLVGPSFSGKTNFILKILSRIPLDRAIYIITKSPLEQYPNPKIKIKEKSKETKFLNKYEHDISVSGDFLGASNSKCIDQFFIRGRQNNLDIYFLSQSCFDLPKRTKRKNSNKKILFNQTLKDIENIYRDVGDMI